MTRSASATTRAMRAGAPSEVSPRSAVSVSMPWESTMRTRRATDGPARRSRSSGPVVACSPQPMATVTPPSGTPPAASSSRSAASTGSLGQGREESGMVTTTERAPRASSRRRGACSGAAMASSTAAPRSPSRVHGGRRLEGVGARHREALRAAPDPRRGGHGLTAAAPSPASRDALRQSHHITATPTKGSSDQRNPLVEPGQHVAAGAPAGGPGEQHADDELRPVGEEGPRGHVGAVQHRVDGEGHGHA